MGSTCTCAHRIRMSEAQNACLRVCLIALSFDGSGMHTTAACCEYLRRRRVKTIKESVESCPLNFIARRRILPMTCKKMSEVDAQLRANCDK